MNKYHLSNISAWPFIHNGTIYLVNLNNYKYVIEYLNSLKRADSI